MPKSTELEVVIIRVVAKKGHGAAFAQSAVADLCDRDNLDSRCTFTADEKTLPATDEDARNFAQHEENLEDDEDYDDDE